MDLLRGAGVAKISHYTPLHYLPFIARQSALLSKPRLAALGFSDSHFRSMSKKQDRTRGFENYAFLTIDQSPRILQSKLTKGFPHIAIEVPSITLANLRYSLCRYNIAMTRKLRRDGNPGFPPSETNGRYYGEKQIPIATTDPDKEAMLEEHLPKRTMIEALVEGSCPLPHDTVVVAYCRQDQALVEHILLALEATWEVRLEVPPCNYDRLKKHSDAIAHFVDRALRQPEWRGDGLEFDRL